MAVQGVKTRSMAERITDAVMFGVLAWRSRRDLVKLVRAAVQLGKAMSKVQAIHLEHGRAAAAEAAGPGPSWTVH